MGQCVAIEFASFDNKSSILKDDLVKNLQPRDRVSIAAPWFSVFGYQSIREQLDQCSEVRFLFTEPTFLKERTDKKAREFYLPRRGRERGVTGTDLEIRLRNELTQSVAGRNCSKWIRKRARFRSFTRGQGFPSFFIVETNGDAYIYQNIEGLTATGLGAEPGSSQFATIIRQGRETALACLKTFNAAWSDDSSTEDVTQSVLDSVEDLYEENAPELVYHSALHDIFSEFMDNLDEDEMPREGTGYRNSKVWSMLYDFQRDGANAIINKLETYDGCILADSVGLGKTFTALAVIKYYESRNRNVLVLCPKKLSDNWMTYRNNQRNNPVAEDRLRYDVLYHTDLGRTRGRSDSGIDLATINWGTYDLVVIDESHNFRNGDRTAVKSDSGENRYTRLMDKVIKDGVHTKVLMLSATPVNNRFLDLQNQLELAYCQGDVDWQGKIGLRNSVKATFAQAQRAYTAWAQLPVDQRTTARLMDMLDSDFFKLLDQVTVARSREQIVRYYDTSTIGPFPERRKPISVRPDLSTSDEVGTFSEIAEALDRLTLANYIPSSYLFPSRVAKYQQESNLSIEGREAGVRRLMAINLLKRLESSVEAFRMTIGKVRSNIEDKLSLVDEFERSRGANRATVTQGDMYDLDFDDESSSEFFVGKSSVDLSDIDWRRWRVDMAADLETLNEIMGMVAAADPEHDAKLLELKRLLQEKTEKPFNPGNRKVLVFTAMADTARYLYDNIALWAKAELGVQTALVTGDNPGKSTIKQIPGDTQSVLSCFSPISKERDVTSPDLRGCNVDILIATDCVSEGQNLQDCDCVINYDIHWNPVRIVQRFGRVDRIGSKNPTIQLVNFWPNVELDEYIKLKERVETRMKITVMTSTGDDDLINAEEKGDLEYRRRQLEQMQNEVVNLEDVSGGVSITDLGLDEFRADLISWIREHGDDSWPPHGIHAVVNGEKPGIIFVLRNVNGGVNISKANRLHPFYLVYVAEDGTIIEDQLHGRDTLSDLRKLCLGKDEPDRALCRAFNKATKGGSDMRRPSALLDDAVASIVRTDRESIVDSFFGSGVSRFCEKTTEGLDDFELLDFVVVI